MKEFFFVRAGKKYNKVMLAEILYAEGSGNNVKLVTGNRVYVINITMQEFEKQVPAELFCRVHKSWIAGLHNISSFTEEVIYLGNTEIPLGKVYQKEFLRKVSIIPMVNE